MRKTLLILTLAIAIIAIITVIFTREARNYGHMDMRVYDAMTNQPVESAYIVLPQSGQSYISDEQGRIYAHGIPIDIDEKLNAIMKLPYGSTIILAYKEGYMPCCIFYAQLYQGRVRSGPNIYLFAESSESDITVTTFIESPNKEWVDKLVRKYAP